MGNSFNKSKYKTDFDLKIISPTKIDCNFKKLIQIDGNKFYYFEPEKTVVVNNNSPITLNFSFKNTSYQKLLFLNPYDFTRNIINKKINYDSPKIEIEDGTIIIRVNSKQEIQEIVIQRY